MQIHELNNFSGEIGAGSYLVADNGSDTGKITAQQLLANTEAHINDVETNLNGRIDNIIAGGDAPSAAEVTDARRGEDGINYPSLGDAIRSQVANLEDDSAYTAEMVGAEINALIDKASSVGTAAAVTTRRWFVDGIIPKGNTITKILYFCASTTSGTLDIEIWSKAGNTLTRKYIETVTPTASFINTAVLNYVTTEDSLVSFKASSSNIRINTTATGEKSLASADLASVVLTYSGLETWNSYQLCATVYYRAYINPNLMEAITETDAKIIALSNKLTDHSDSVGTGALPTTARFFVDGVIPKGSLISRILYRCAAATSGTLDIELWSKSGDALTRVFTKTVTPAASMINAADINYTADENIMISFAPSDSNIRLDTQSAGYSILSTTDKASTSLNYSDLNRLGNMQICATIYYLSSNTNTESADTSYFVVDVNGGGNYISFSRAIIDTFTKYPNATLLVKQGVYDIYQEMIDIYGNDYWDTLTADSEGLAKYYMGLPLGNGVKIIGTPGATLKMYNASANPVVAEWFSIFYGMHNFDSIYQGGEIYNLKMDCKKIRYAVHLDPGGAPRSEYYRIENCEMKLDNSGNTLKDVAYVIGTGGGAYTTYDFIKNYLYPVFPPNARDSAALYYHNSDAVSPQNRCNILDNYIDNGGTIRTDPNGASSNNCLVFISNNSLGSPMMLNGQYGTNLKIVEWNNVIRS